MLISNSQILETLEILEIRHRKTVNNFSDKYHSHQIITQEDTINVQQAADAITTYNSFKQRYQTI